MNLSYFFTSRPYFFINMILTFQEFLKYYNKHGKCINQIQKPRKPLNERQIKSRYDKYLKSEEKTNNLRKENLKWRRLVNEVRSRDRDSCRLWFVLNSEERRILIENAGHLLNILDPAHVFGKGSKPELKFEIDNIILLNRYSHTMLDENKNPITGDYISIEEKESWWKRILGKNFYNNLKEK